MPNASPLVVAVVHLPALPGAPLYGGDLGPIRERALRETQQLCEAGADALIVENFGDAPFFPEVVPPVTVAAMAALIAELVRASSIPIGVNVLRNDARSALAIAAATGAAFIRVNVHAGARVTDQGLLTGRAYETLRERRLLGAEHVRILADVHVKHSAPLGERSITDEALELAERALCDAVLVTGSGTGAPPSAGLVALVKAAVHVPVLVASGVSLETASDLLHLADGCIIGSALKRGGDARNEVDPQRAREMIAHLKALHSKGVSA